MKKSRIIISLAFALILVCALAVSSSARWWDDNPFEDVDPGAWYYDAVRIANENGLFNGVSETEFGVKSGMTRAMFVTVLSAAADYDPAEYAETPFADVPAGKWYTAPVAWAYKNGVTGGTGNGNFSPNAVITRQELVTMLRKYAELAGYDTEVSETTLDSFPDADKAAGWASEALCWAYEKGIISGVGSGDSVLLAPKNVATRVQVAQMMVKLLATRPVREINGNDISQYVIVYNKDETGSDTPLEQTAHSLSRHIRLSLGYELPVVSDETEPTEYEILVGRTNREDLGLVTVDRGAFEDNQKFICQVQGSRLVMTGIDQHPDKNVADRTRYELAGTCSAEIYFSEKVLGLDFYTNDVITAAPDPIISLPDGWTYVDGPIFNTRCLYLKAGSGAYLSSGWIYSEWGCGAPHQLGNLITGNLGDNVDKSMPCLSEPENVASLIANVKKILDERPHKNCVGLIQSDSDSYCRCEKCLEAYRKYGTRGAVIYLACNAVCEALEDEYPEVKFMTWAYSYGAKPPVGMELHKNLILVYNTLVLCPAHAYSDTTCPFNADSPVYLAKWQELASEIYVWDHTSAFGHNLVPFPDWDSILVNAKYFDDHGVKGVFLNGSSVTSDFIELRAYLYSQVYRDPRMSEEEYDYRMNGFLKASYGAGWKDLRKYIDRICEWSEPFHHKFSVGADAYYDYATVTAQSAEVESWWDAAEAAASNDAELERIRLHRYAWTYLMQCATYDAFYTNGTGEQRAAYVAKNEELIEGIKKYELRIGSDDPKFDPETSPETW